MQLVTGAADGVLRLWSLPADDDALPPLFNASAALLTLRRKGPASPSLTCVSMLSPAGQGRHCGAGDADGCIHVWDLVAPGGALLRALPGHKGAITAIIPLDSSHFASASMDKTIRLWNAEHFSCQRVLAGHAHWVQALGLIPAFEGDDVDPPRPAELVSAGADKTLRFWAASGGEPVRVLETEPFSPPIEPAAAVAAAAATAATAAGGGGGGAKPIKKWAPPAVSSLSKPTVFGIAPAAKPAAAVAANKPEAAAVVPPPSSASAQPIDAASQPEQTALPPASLSTEAATEEVVPEVVPVAEGAAIVSNDAALPPIGGGDAPTAHPIEADVATDATAAEVAGGDAPPPPPPSSAVEPIPFWSVPNKAVEHAPGVIPPPLASGGDKQAGCGCTIS